MDGFKRGFEAIGALKSIYDPIQDDYDEYLAFALGAIAAIYHSMDDSEKHWEVRNKVWQVEEALGESRQKKLETTPKT